VKFRSFIPKWSYYKSIKKKDLIELLPFIPPIKHQFYFDLKTDRNDDDGYPFIENEDEESEEL